MSIMYKSIKSIMRCMGIPEKVGMFISKITKCNIIIGIGNNSEEDRTRVDEMMSDGIFSGVHLVTISNDVNYDYAESLATESLAAESLTTESPQHIALNFDFCNNMCWFKIQKILAGKVNIFTFDMSTTKFVNWRYTRFGSLDFNIFANIKALIGDGVIYYPVEPSKTIIPANSSIYDEIALIDKMSDTMWINKRFAVDNTFVNVYRIEHSSASLHTQTIKHLRSARSEVQGKITILTNNKNIKYVESLIDSIFSGIFTEDNSIIMYCDTQHKKIDNETNIYFYYDTADLIYETYKVFMMSEMFDHVGIKEVGPVTNIKYPSMTKGWIVASNNKKIFGSISAVSIKDIRDVLPEYAHISILL